MTDETDKSLPQNIDAEQSVIGALFLDQNSVAKVARFLRAEDFYMESHRKIYEAILTLEENGHPVDLITVVNHLRDAGILDRIGGAAYVASLASMLPTAANIEYHAHIVEEKALLRNLIQIATRIANLGYEGEDVEQLIDQSEKMILELTSRRASSAFTTMKELVMQVLRFIEERYQNKGAVLGVESGFKDIDKLCCGLQPGDLIIVAGRPAMGKTSFGLTIAHHVALSQRLPVAVFSLEMSKEQLVQRMLCSEAKVDQQKVRNGLLDESDWVKLTKAATKLAIAPLYIDDSALLSVRQVRAKAKRLQLEKGLSLIVIDYLQLMQSSLRVENRQQEISEISRSLKSLAKDLQVPVVALAQLSRQVEQRQDKRPIMSDLRDSGSIEQDADIVMFIYRDEYYKPDTDKKGITEIIIAKQRNGPTGAVELAFIKEYTRFLNLSKLGDGDVPYQAGITS
jgi:replicative DNA helicase